MEFDIARAWAVPCKRISPLRNIVAVFDSWKLFNSYLTEVKFIYQINYMI